MITLLRLMMEWAGRIPEEVCGLMYGGEIHVLRNVARDPRAEYAMDPDHQFLLMSERGWPDVVFHTHPAGTREPSSLDHRSALPNVPYAVATRDWAGVYRDGQQIMEVVMSGMTNDVGEVFKGEDGDWYWHVQAPNGKIIATGGEGFTHKTDAVDAMYHERPDLKPAAPMPEASSASDVADAGGGTSAGTTAGPAVGPVTGGPGANSSGVGPTGGTGI